MNDGRKKDGERAESNIAAEKHELLPILDVVMFYFARRCEHLQLSTSF